MTDSLEAYVGLTLMLATEVDPVRCDCEEWADTVEGEEAEELLDEDEESWSRDILGICGLDLSLTLAVVVICGISLISSSWSWSSFSPLS